MSTWTQRLYEDLSAGRIGPAGSPVLAGLVEGVHALVVLFRETVRDRLHVRAAMLAYWTAVAMVPILLLGFALTGPLGLGLATREAVKGVLYDSIFAESVEEVGVAIDTLLAGANLGTFGVLGLVGVMFIGSQLYFNAELAYNDIFQCRVRRSWILRFTLFYAGITLVPLLLAGGFVLSSRLHVEGAPTFLARVLPVLLTASAFVGAIRVLPCVEVRWPAALAGGLISAVAFEAAKVGFGAYTEVLGTKDNLGRIYGSVAFLPVFLLWTYFLWLIVLFGVELAWFFQNYGRLVADQRRVAADPHANRRSPDAFFALAVMAAVAERFLAGKGPASVFELAGDTAAEPRHVQLVVEVLEEAGLVVEGEDGRLSPARSPDQLGAGEIIRAYRDRVVPEVRGPAMGAVEAALLGVDRTLGSSLGRLLGGAGPVGKER
jgi:membrane protein